MPDRIDLHKSTVAPVVHYPAAATIATKAMPAVAGRRNVLTSVKYSYDGVPSAGSISIVYTLAGATITLTLDETNGGPKRWPMDEEIVGDVNSAITVSLASGAGTVKGKVIVSGYQIN